MTRSQPRRLVLIVALALTAVLAVPTTAGAATKACKLLKRSEIKNELDQAVGKPEKGLVAQIGSDCKWDVSASDTKPEGLVATFVQTVGAKIAYDTNQETIDDQGQLREVSGLGKAFYQDDGFGGGVVWVLKGSVLLTVQGSFVSLSDEPQVDAAELQDELVALAKIAKKRL